MSSLSPISSIKTEKAFIINSNNIKKDTSLNNTIGFIKDENILLNKQNNKIIRSDNKKSSQFNIDKLTRHAQKNKIDNNNLQFNAENDISSNFDETIKSKKYIYFEKNIEEKIKQELYFKKYIAKKNDVHIITEHDIAAKIIILETIMNIFSNLLNNKLISNIEIKYYQQLELDIFYSLISLNYYYKNIELLKSIKIMLIEYLTLFRKKFNKFIYNYAIYLNICDDIRYLNKDFLIIYYPNNKSSTNIKIIITLTDSISTLNDIIGNLNNYNNILNKKL